MINSEKKLLYDSFFNYIIQYPSTWEVIPGFAGTLLSFQSPLEGKKDKFRDLLNIIIVPDLEDMSLEDFSQRSIENLDKEINILKEVEAVSDTTLSGLLAMHVSFLQETQDLKLYDYNIWTIFESMAYVLAFSTLNKDNKKFIPIFYSMRDSFKITLP